MTDRGKVMNGLQMAYTYSNVDEENTLVPQQIVIDAITLLKAQGEVIDALLKVGYPHNFQREPRWIVNYMYAITDVIKKAAKWE